MPENRPSRYAIVIERAGDNDSAYVPALPGCVATGVTIAEARREIVDAIRLHVDGLCADGEPVPTPTSPDQLQPALNVDDPFATFIEWAGEADEAAYADL